MSVIQLKKLKYSRYVSDDEGFNHCKIIIKDMNLTLNAVLNGPFDFTFTIHATGLSFSF